MAKLTTEVIKELYLYGKKVYAQEIGTPKAADFVTQKFPGQISKTSAEFYINLYSFFVIQFPVLLSFLKHRVELCRKLLDRGEHLVVIHSLRAYDTDRSVYTFVKFVSCGHHAAVFHVLDR